MNTDAKLQGYVLRNNKGYLLTHKCIWMPEDMTGGWIWSENEVSELLRESSEWEYKPTHKQAAYLNRHNGSTVIYGKMEPV